MHTKDFFFSIKEKDERVLRVLHRHWFDIVVQFLPLVVFLLVIAGSFFVAPYLFTDVTVAGTEIFFFFQTFFLLIAWLYGFLIWVDYYLDIWVITTRRVVNIEQRGLFTRHVSELKFSQVQDVSTEVEGLIPTFLNYGNVHAQTAAEEARFTFRHVPDPYHIKALLMEQQQKAHQKDIENVHKTLNNL